jgi:uncharacterized protein YegL
MAGVESLGNVLPIYFVADESGSMAPHIGELNDGLLALQAGLQGEPFAAAKVRFAIIGFSDRAESYLLPTDLRTLGAMPTLAARGMTSYVAAFNELGYRISVDIPTLKSQGFRVHRPAVFFLTDGQPNRNEDWRAARANLLAQQAAPNIIAFGIGDADPATVSQLATKPDYAWIAERGVETGVAVSEFVVSLTQSVISSGQGMAAGAGALQLEKPEGFTLAVDVV